MATETQRVIISTRREESPERLRGNIEQVLAEYPNKVLAEVTPEQYAGLLREGYRVEDLSAGSKIRVGDLAVDPAQRGEAPLAAEEEDGGTQHYFVQFIGPVKPEWIEGIQAEGVRPLTYYHDHAYLVRATPSEIRRVENHPFVRATLPYGPGFKLDSEVRRSRTLESQPEETQEYWIVIFSDTGDVEGTLARLRELGAEILEDEEDSAAFFERFHVRMPASAVEAAARLPNVYTIEAFHPIVMEDEVADQIVAGNYNAANEPQVGYLAWLNAMGVDGSGVTIGINDSGIAADHPAYAGRLNSISTTEGSHGTMVAGQAAANYVSPQAPDVAADLTDPDGFVYGVGIAPAAELLNLSGLSSPARNCVINSGPSGGDHGRIINNSWGQGTNNPMDYRSNERAWDEDVRDADHLAPGNTPLVVCFSAGNEGSSGLTRPKASKNTIVTGNFENFRPDEFGAGADDINDRISTSSIGNCGDGRVKPDVVAPGERTASAAFPQPGTISHWLRYGGGTSAASPKTAGACALLMQWWRQRHTDGTNEKTPSPALLKAMLINSAVDTGEGGPIPNPQQGWGRVHLTNALTPEVPALYVDQEIVLQPASDDVVFRVETVDPARPLKVTLVWTDVPGNLNSGTAGNPALVNALGLRVVQGANTWFGNNFAGGVSQPGGVQDAIQSANPGVIVNNVQNVFLPTPSGTYEVRISPENIVGDCRTPADPFANPANFRQDFALVVQNARLVAEERLDVMLTIDRTGSMSGARMAAAIASGQEFFDLIPTGAGHRAGLVSYAVPCALPFNAPLSSKATVDVDLADVTDTLKTSAIAAVGGLTADGCTSIGAGLTRAMHRICDDERPLARKVLVLLSDGQENRPPWVGDILPRLRKEYRVHAVGLGGSINAALMQQIADDAHGTFLHTLLPDEIAPLYREMFALEMEEEVVDHVQGAVPPAGEEESERLEKFPVVAADRRATFIVGWKNPQVALDVELISPNGDVITARKATAARGMSCVRRATHVIYRIERPRTANPSWEGLWTVRIRRTARSSAAAETYNASLLVRSGLRLNLSWNGRRFFTKDTIQLKARVSSDLALQSGAVLQLQTLRPRQGFGSILARAAQSLRPADPQLDLSGGPFFALDALNDRDWQQLYETVRERADSLEGVEVGNGGDLNSARLRSTQEIRLSKRLRAEKDGIYTHRVTVEGRTESGALYKRLRTVSQYVAPRVEGRASLTELRAVPGQGRRALRLVFTPKDVHGNLLGPGHAGSIQMDVENGKVRGKIEDRLDGSYTAEVEVTSGRPEDVRVNLSFGKDRVAELSGARISPDRPEETAPSGEQDGLRGKVEELRFDGNGNFFGYRLRTASGSVELVSQSSRLAAVLTEAMERGLTVSVHPAGSSGTASEVRVESP